MQRRRVWVTAVALATTAMLALVAGGCTGTDGGTTDSGETSDLPPQEGLEVGATAPDFRMQSQDQVMVALKDYSGTKNVILVFYPADFTPV